MAFGEHLGADKNTRAATVNFRQLLFKRAFAAGGVAVDTRQRHAGEQRRQALFQLFGAKPYRHQMRGTTLRALARHGALAVTVVAAQLML